MKLYNSLTRSIEELKPINPPEVTLYTCGPTVYNLVHIGNLRAATFFDVLSRALSYRGFAVKHVINMTDIDDKIIKGCKQTGKSLVDFTTPWIEAYRNDVSRLGVKAPTFAPRATEYVNGMVEMIETLIKKGHAYKTDKGDVYYRINSFPHYGQLVQLEKATLKQNADQRMNLADEYDKDSANDFALWKAWDPADGDIFWESTLGKGRPGWHIECSVMAAALLGKTIDIHAGGIDLQFPHHTNEIAQSEGCYGCTFANIWMHNEHLLVEGKKMSKSLKNFYTLNDLLNKGCDPRVLRLDFIKTHYRAKIDFRFENLEQTKILLQKFDAVAALLKENPRSDEKTARQEVQKVVSSAEASFCAALDDDLNMSLAITAVLEFISEIHKLSPTLSSSEAQTLLAQLEKFDSVLNILPKAADALSAEEQALFDARMAAKKAKDFKKSDELRAELLKRKILLEDSGQSTRWKRI